MSRRDSNGVRPRTALEQKIWQRRQTLSEFVDYAAAFAREHGEPATLSERHMKRLASGRGADGSPIARPRPATSRLLERIFGTEIDELLSPPDCAYAIPAAQALRVVVAVVVRDTEVLIVCRRSDSDGALLWQFPAGIVKPGNEPETVAFSETLAETGIRCAVVSSIGTRLHPKTNVICDYLLCDFLAGEVTNVDLVENIDALWVDAARLTEFIPAEEIYRPVLDSLRTTQKSARK